MSAACKTVANLSTHDWRTAGRFADFVIESGAVRRSAYTHQRPATIAGWLLGRRVLAEPAAGFPSQFAVRRATLLFVSPARVACRRATRHMSPSGLPVLPDSPGHEANNG